MKILTILCAVALTGCATPATQVKVPTMTVEQAWNAQRAQDFALSPDTRVMNPAARTQAPIPIISAPTIRLGYVKPWQDGEGVRHYGKWVAVQIEPPRWVQPDGTVDVWDRTARGSRK